jgi:hypothetical protein
MDPFTTECGQSLRVHGVTFLQQLPKPPGYAHQRVKAKHVGNEVIVFDSRSWPTFSAVTPSTVLRRLATKAARCLGISRLTVREKLQRFGLYSAQETGAERG